MVLKVVPTFCEESTVMSGPLAAFIDESYDDTLSLMTELRDYLTQIQSEAEEPGDGEAEAPLDPEVRTIIVREISAMTRQLTEAMAWLLLQKAVSADEISDDEARIRADGLFGSDTGHAGTFPEGARVPIEVRGYIDRNRRVYDQVLRLREMTERRLEE